MVKPYSVPIIFYNVSDALIWDLTNYWCNNLHIGQFWLLIWCLCAPKFIILKDYLSIFGLLYIIMVSKNCEQIYHADIENCGWYSWFRLSRDNQCITMQQNITFFSTTLKHGCTYLQGKSCRGLERWIKNWKDISCNSLVFL